MQRAGIANTLLVIGTALLPVYLWSSGGVQVSHVILIAGGLFVLAHSDLRLSVPEVLMAALALTVFVREAVASIDSEYTKVLIFPVYVAFNFLLFMALLRWFRYRNAVTSFGLGLAAAAAVAGIGLLYLGYDVSLYSYERAVGTFNNPNQLGYFAVCLFSVASLLYLCGYFKPVMLIALVTASFIFAVLSLSKAAMISVFLPFIAIGFVLARAKKMSLMGPVIAFAIVFAGYYLTMSGALDDIIFAQRLSALGEDSDDSFVGRGYAVIKEAGPIEILIGFGAEETSRIYGEGKDVHKMHEIHSTIFSFFVTYGILGGTLFLLIMLLWGRTVFRGFGLLGLICVVGPPLAYGLAHNGSRFTLFWILVALSFTIKEAAGTTSPVDAAETAQAT
jgi:hypothetical protein